MTESESSYANDLSTFASRSRLVRVTNEEVPIHG